MRRGWQSISAEEAEILDESERVGLPMAEIRFSRWLTGVR